MVINPITEHLVTRAQTVGSWSEGEEVNCSLRLHCMYRKPHSLTGDLGGEEKKYLNIQQARERETRRGGGVAKWISGKLKGRRVYTLIFYTRCGECYHENEHSWNVL